MTIFGKLEAYTKFQSDFIEARNIDVWLPPEYENEPERRFPVIYMHDGQNLFDETIAFTGTDWGIDEAIVALTQAGKIRPAIVVGAWNSGERWLDYMPEKPLSGEAGEKIKQYLQVEKGGQTHSDNYLCFLVDELKPFIDRTYRTLPDRPDTFIMGSSMGGMVSLYAVCEYPQVYGGAGCLSTHWPGAEDLYINWLKTALPEAGKHKLYFDYGTATLDAAYEPYQLQVDGILSEKGYQRGKDWITLKFPGAEHNEAAWRKRVNIPLQFLLAYPD